MPKAFVIAAPWSNSGKTTITLGLCRYLHNQGKKVQPFKCGPDYIDTIHHGTAAHKRSINLDTVMMSPKHLKTIFADYSSTADISIVEGVMGLFDGSVKDKGSTAEIAKLLDLPIILIVNAKAMAYTIAPILHGLKTFDPEVKIAGVLFNFVRTASHYAFLKEACDTVGIPSLGYIPPEENIAIPSRHLGLHIDASFDTVIENAATHISNHIVIDRLLEYAKELEIKRPKKKGKPEYFPSKVIAIAQDEAFTFTYQENLRQLEKLGKVVFFSPIHDTTLPQADYIYLAGGYPELYLEALSTNKSMCKAIQKAAKDGVKIWAECGGMMYLGNTIINENGKAYTMARVFDYSTSMEHKKLRLGYRKVLWNEHEIWGHEFHYSSLIEKSSKASIAKIYTARNKEIDTKIFKYKNTYASYLHLYWGAGIFTPFDFS